MRKVGAFTLVAACWAAGGIAGIGLAYLVTLKIDSKITEIRHAANVRKWVLKSESK